LRGEQALVEVVGLTVPFPVRDTTTVKPQARSRAMVSSSTGSVSFAS
jgi:hypothetical protein